MVLSSRAYTWPVTPCERVGISPRNTSSASTAATTTRRKTIDNGNFILSTEVSSQNGHTDRSALISPCCPNHFRFRPLSLTQFTPVYEYFGKVDCIFSHVPFVLQESQSTSKCKEWHTIYDSPRWEGCFLSDVDTCCMRQKASLPTRSQCQLPSVKALFRHFCGRPATTRSSVSED